MSWCNGNQGAVTAQLTGWRRLLSCKTHPHPRLCAAHAHNSLTHTEHLRTRKLAHIPRHVWTAVHSDQGKSLTCAKNIACCEPVMPADDTTLLTGSSWWGCML